MLERFSITIDQCLMRKFLKLASQRGYNNRSEAIRDLIRQSLVEEEWHGDGEVIGIISIVYDHHQRQLLGKIADIQHDSVAWILSSTHIHLDHHNCLEVIITKGKASVLKNLADQLISLKGVKKGTISTASTGKEI